MSGKINRGGGGGVGGTSLTGLGTDNRLMKWNGTDTAQSTGITCDDSDNLSGIGTLGLSGAITQNEDGDVENIFGRVRLGSPASDQAVFSHYDANTAGARALVQLNSGRTELQSGAGQVLNLKIAGTNTVQIDSSSTAGDTRLLIYDVDNATLERVSVGAADSGGSGFKVLRIAN